ncbi:MAG: hypothetical protein ACRDDM_10130 [Paraclostridium sp.]
MPRSVGQVTENRTTSKGAHFEDYNYYEIKLTDEDTLDEIVENPLSKLVLERSMNKLNSEVNLNNVRYFEK